MSLRVTLLPGWDRDDREALRRRAEAPAEELAATHAAVAWRDEPSRAVIECEVEAWSDRRGGEALVGAAR